MKVDKIIESLQMEYLKSSKVLSIFLNGFLFKRTRFSLPYKTGSILLSLRT